MSESKSASVVFTNSSLLAKNAQVTADSAKTAAEVAQNQAITAQKTADGKNSIYRGSDPSTVPTAGLKEGDLYFTDNAVYTWTGTTWEKTVSDTTGTEIHAKVEAAMQESQKSVADLKSEVESKVSEIDSNLSATTTDLTNVKTDLEDTKKNLATTADDLKADLSAVSNDLSATKTSLADTRDSLATTTSDLTNVKADLADTKNNLTTTTNDLKTSLSTVSNDLSATKTNLEDTKNSLSTTVSDLQKQTGQLSGSLDTANSKIEYNSKAIAEVKHTAEEIKADVADNKGNIASVTQTANAVKADLANTKGDVAAVKAEADSLTSQMTDANGNISQLQQDTDGLSATVGGAAVDIIPNLDQQFVMGFGIANTTWQDNNSYIKLPTAQNDKEVLPQTAEFTLRIPWQAGKTYMQSIIFETDATINDSVQPQWTWYTSNGHVMANATLAKLGNNTYRLIGSHTPTAKETTQYLRVFDIWNFTDFVDVTTGTYLKFRNPRIWCPDDNSLVQLKLTADGLTSKVADAQDNISNLQQTATGLQTQMTNTQEDVSNLKVTANEISADLTNAKGDIARVETTADSLTTTVGKMPEQWQQAINDKASAQVLDSNVDMNSLTTAGTYLVKDFSVKNSPISAWFMATVEATADHTRVVQRVKKDSANVAYERSNNDDGWTSWERVATGTDVISIKQTMDSITTRVSNTEGNVSNLQQTATKLQSDLTNTKGDISSLQQTASGLTSRVGSAEGNISQLQQTAKGLQSTVTDQSGKISQLQQDTDGLSATVGGAAIDIIPNLDQQFVMGYGIANTTWQDNNSYIKLPTAQNDKEVLPQTAEFTLRIPWQAGKTYMQSIIFETDATINDSVQPQWTWYAGGIHDSQNATLAKLGNNTYRLIGAYTPTQAKVNSGYLRVFDIWNFGDFVDVTTGTYLKFRNPHIWCPDDNSLAQLKLTADGLTSKVADTQGNVSNLQQTTSELTAYVKQSKGSKTLASLLSMDPNNSTIAQVVNGKPIAAINLSSEGDTLIAGKKIMLDGDVTINGTAFASKLKATGITVDQLVAGSIDAKKIDIVNLNANNITTGTLNGVNINGSVFKANATITKNDGDVSYKLDQTTTIDGSHISSVGLSNDREFNFFIDSMGMDMYNRIGSSMQNTLSVFLPISTTDSTGPTIRIATGVPYDEPTAKTIVRATSVQTPYVQTSDARIGPIHIYNHHIRSDASLYVSNDSGTNFDDNGSVGFQVYGGIGLGKSTIYTPGTDIYIQQGNADQNLGQSYSSANKTTIHAHKLVSQVANTVSSRLSIKTDITPVSYDRALAAVEGTEMYDYRYTSDDTGQHYVSGIIDDVNPDPQYHMDEMLINKERTARIDSNLVGYHHVVIQKLLERVAALEEKVK